MGKFKQSLITTAGKSILLGGEVTYTTAKLFSQDVSSMTDDQVRALTALTGQLMSVGVSVEAMDNSTVSVKAVFSNKGLTDDLTFSSVGWFAKAGSGNETLIAVTPIEGTKLLCAGLPNSSTDAINIAMNMAIGDSTTVNVVIDPAGTVSPVDLDSAISKIQTDVNTKATKADVDKEITTLTADKANSTDITNLQNQVDSKTSGTIVTAYDVASKKPTTETKSYTSEELVDQGALTPFADQINQLKGRQSVDTPDFNTLTNSGVYYISNPQNGKNSPTGYWGTLAVFNGNGARIMQIYAADDGTSAFVRTYDAGNSTWGAWNQIAWTSDITNLQNAVNNIDSTRTPLVNGASGDDLFSFKTNQIRLYDGNGAKCKNLPPAANTQWFTVQYVFETPNNDGIAIYRSPANEVWTIGNNGGHYVTGDWVRVANATDITNLQNAVNSKVNVDGGLFSAPGSINSWADVQANGNKNVLRSVRTEGTSTDFDTGNYDAGIVFGGNDTKALISVGYTGNTARVTGGNNSAVWHEDIAWKSDITNLQNTIQAQQTKLTDDVYTKAEVDSAVTKLQSQITEIQSKNYIEGYNCANESDAETYSKAHPTTLVTVS